MTEKEYNYWSNIYYQNIYLHLFLFFHPTFVILDPLFWSKLYFIVFYVYYNCVVEDIFFLFFSNFKTRDYYDFNTCRLFPKVVFNNIIYSNSSHSQYIEYQIMLSWPSSASTLLEHQDSLTIKIIIDKNVSHQ